VSSELSCDYALVGELDTALEDSYCDAISGETSTIISIPVPTAGSHSVDIGYEKDSSISVGSDCAWFVIVE
jgi:hypothetical protein